MRVCTLQSSRERLARRKARVNSHNLQRVADLSTCSCRRQVAMIAAGYGTSVALWSPFDNEEIVHDVNPFPNCSQLVCDVCWHPSGDLLASCGRRNGLGMYTAKHSDVYQASTASRDVASSLAFSDDHLLQTDSTGHLHLWRCAREAGKVFNTHASQHML